MELLVLNEYFEAVQLIDTYESLIWTERYYKFGDFEIYTTVTDELVQTFKQDYYIWRKDTNYVMVIEDVRITSDVEDGARLIVSGRSLESILDRRIVWDQIVLKGSLQDGIEKLLNENVISPLNENRKINNFIFQTSDDPLITSPVIDVQYTGDNLYDVIQKLCESNSIGFRLTLTQDLKLVFSMYTGTNRSYSQTKVPYVVFSPKFDNIVNSNYLESRKTLKTVALVAGEGEEPSRKKVSVEDDDGGGCGLDRREMFVNATSISSKVNGVKLTESQYTAQLSQKGKEELAINSASKSFEGEVESTRLFRYGKDFFLGDIVQISNEYGVEAKTRIVEIVLSDNVDGFEIYPTFVTIESGMDEMEDEEEEEEIVLPEGYIRYRYIESNGTQFIDTGFVPNCNTRIVVDYAGSKESDVSGFFGSVSDMNSSAFGAWVKDGVLYPHYADNEYDAKPIDLRNIAARNIYDFDKNKVTVGGKTTNFTETAFVCNSTLTLFAVNSTDIADGRRVSGKMYRASIYDNGCLIRDFYPCENPDGEIGMYDVVNHVFYGNADNSIFFGRVYTKLPVGYTECDYIQSTGKEYIDTGCEITRTIRLICDFQFTSLKRGYRNGVFGFHYHSWFDDTRYNFFDFWGDGESFKFHEGQYNVISEFDKSIPYDTRHIVDRSENECSLDGVTKKITVKYNGSYSSAFKVQLFKLNMYENTAVMKLYGCKMYDGGVCVRHFIPCKNPYSEIGLYDIVNCKFYPNAGEGYFIQGRIPLKERG